MELHRLYDRAARPAGRRISRTIFRSQGLEAVSHETVSAVLRGDSVPAWGKVQSIVTALARLSVRPVSEEQIDQLMELFYGLWIAIGRSPETVPEPAKSEPVDVAPQPAAPAPTTAPADESTTDRRRDNGAAATRLMGTLPDRNPDFTGREILLDTMRRLHRSHPHQPLVLYGLGGVGKTQLAREYVERYADQYAIVWWVSAGREERTRESLVSLAERLDLPMRQNAELTVMGVIDHLQQPKSNFLLVLDGAGDYDIRPFIPSIGGNVIVTNRDPQWAQDSANNGLEVLDFDLAEAIQFLRKRDPDMTREQATEVFARLGRFPLALEQFASLRQATNRPWDELLAALDDPSEGLLSAGESEPAHYPDTVATSLRLALGQLRDSNPSAALIFELFAWFGSEPVAVLLLRRGANGNLPPGLKRTLSSPISLRRVVADINRYGLGRLLTEDQSIEVQPLMRLALRDILSDEDRRRARDHVQVILIAADPGWPDELTYWDLHRAMAPHILPAGLIQSRDPAAHWAVHHQIRYRYLLGDYEDARRLGEAAVTAWREPSFLGPDNETVLLAAREWANALRAIGRYAEARELTADAMQRLRTTPGYGEDHPHALVMARSHAADLRIAGEYQAALELDEATYEGHIRLYEQHGERTGISRQNLAVSLRLLGRFADAEAIDRAELSRRRARHGNQHRRTLLTLNALAEDLYGLGRYREVLELRTGSHDLGRRTVRASELGILLARRTFGLAHRRLGEHAQAIELLRAHYYECIESFGAVHEITLASTMSYANALRDRPAERGEAYATAVEAVTAYEEAFGATNPLTLAAQVNQAVHLRANKETQWALRADEAACQALLDALGEPHPFTVVAMINLATDRASIGDTNGALNMSEQAYAVARETRGPQHSDTLAAAANLTIDRAAAGSRVPAEPTLDAVLTDLRRTLGPNHPTVAAVASGARIECDIEPPST